MEGEMQQLQLVWRKILVVSVLAESYLLPFLDGLIFLVCLSARNFRSLSSFDLTMARSKTAADLRCVTTTVPTVHLNRMYSICLRDRLLLQPGHRL